jgi:hypothetical protein
MSSASTLTPNPESTLVASRVAECAAAVRDAFANSGVWFETGEGIAKRGIVSVIGKTGDSEEAMYCSQGEETGVLLKWVG